MYGALISLANDVTSDLTKLIKLTTSNTNIAKQIKVALSQNKVLTDLLSKKICSGTVTQSENQNANKRQRTDKTRRRENQTIAEEKQWDPLRYFWTLVHIVEVVHNSWTCCTAYFNKNHKKTATLVYKMVGIYKNKY